MSDTDLIHELFKEEDNFEYLVKEMDSEQSMYELISSVEEIGGELQNELERDVMEINDITIGWMRIAWEGHHKAAQLEGQSFADMIEGA